jgi:hypothetical protein
MNKCPYCYRYSGFWKHDPILSPHGAKYNWSDETHLIYVPEENNRLYKGIQQIIEDEVMELQEELKAIEEDVLEEGNYTIFSPLNISGKFQIIGKHIKEMRNSIEKILEAKNLYKIEYFNYDEAHRIIVHPLGYQINWYDPNIDDNFQVKYIHIEDLRHWLQHVWMEKFNISDVGRIISPGRITPAGDIGIWQSLYYDNYSLLPDNNEYTKDPQQDEEGMWYIPSGYNIKEEWVFLSPYNEITISGKNKYLKAKAEGIGYKTKKEFYHYWYPGFYAYYTDMYIKTPDVMLSFFGYFRGKIKITQDKIFVVDIDCTIIPSTIKLDIDGEIIDYKAKPELNITIWLSDSLIYGVGNRIEYEYKIIDVKDISETITLDLWNEKVKDNPTYKYVEVVGIALAIPFIKDHSKGYTYNPIKENYEVGSIILNKLDNIGLIRR